MDAARLFVRVSVAGAAESKRDLQSMGAEVNKAQRNFDRLATGGRNVLTGGFKILERGAIAAGVGLGYAAKQSIDFQDAFAGVRKTVSGSKADLDALDKQLRSLSTRIPVSYTDLAGIAQEAGALGVATPKVAEFTEVVSRLSAATVGLTPEAAAEAFGKLGNVLKLNAANADPKGYERLGSALIELGNNAASSEGDIIEVAKRFGAAGTQAGLSGAQILGMSSAIASLGVEPEAAGSALSRTFNRITTQLATGSDKVKALARVSGESAAQFKKSWATDATGAFETFLRGLSKMDKFGAAKALKDAGITNVRDVSMILLLSQNYGELARQINLSTTAYKDNTALQSVSETRFNTLQGKITKFANSIREGAAAMGDEFAPALGRLLDKALIAFTSHRSDFIRIGHEIGTAIDSIDWGKVQSAAEDVAGVVKGIYDIIKLIPPQIDMMVAGFVGVNRLTGGAAGQIGGGLIDMAGGLAGLAGSALGGRGGAVGKVGSTIGMLGAQRVWIVGSSIPLGGGGLGGPGIPGGTDGTGNKLLSLLKWLPVVGLGLEAGNIQADAMQSDLIKNHPEMVATEAGGTGGRTALAEIGDFLFRGGRGSVPPMLPNGTQAGGSITPGGLANPILDRGGRELGRMTGKMKDDLNAVVDIQRGVWAEFRGVVQDLRRAVHPEDVRRTARAATARVMGGAGNVAGTRDVLDALKAQYAHAMKTHDPETAAVLRAAIAKVEHRLTARELIQKQLAAAEKISRSSESSKDKIADLTRIQRNFAARGDTHAAAIVKKAIDEEKAKVARAATAAGQQAAAAIKDKDLSTTVTINPQAVNVTAQVSSREITRLSVKNSKYGKVYID